MQFLLRARYLAMCLLLAPAVPAKAASLYHLAASLPLGGAVKWDYLQVDPVHHRLFISHGTQETVVDLTTLKIAGALTGLDGSHGLAIDQHSGTIWADSARKSLAFAFSPDDFAPRASVKVLPDADGMSYDSASKTIFVSGGDGEGFTPINPATRTAYPVIDLHTVPEGHAADGMGALYVALVDKNQIARIDTATRKITATWPAPGCIAPTGLTLDPAKRLVFTSCQNGVLDVLNADTGALAASLPIGKGTDQMAFDPLRHRAISANGDGSLSVVDDTGATPKLLASIPTKRGARTLAIDPASGDIYTVTATIIGTQPPRKPHGRPHYIYAPGSLVLYVFAPGG